MAGPSAKLVGQKEPVSGQEIVCAGPISVGRDPTANSIPLNHPSISRKHGRVFPEGTHWMVEDLNSSNGVFLNDVRIQKVQLKDGDVVRFGDVPFKFVVTQSQSEQLPSDGFEPTMMIAGGIKPEQQRQASMPPSDFEGTVFGQQAPAFFADQMKKPDQGAAALAESRGKEAAAAVPVTAEQAQAIRKDVPNLFMLKMKAVMVFVIVFAVLGGGIWLFISSGNKARKSKALVRVAQTIVSEFRSKEQDLVSAKDMATVYQKDIDALDAHEKQIQGTIAELQAMKASPEHLNQAQKYLEQIQFYRFERKYLLAIQNKEEDTAMRLVDSMEKEGAPAQKEVVPLAKALVPYGIFRAGYPNEPERSTKAAPLADVKKLDDAWRDLMNTFEKTKGSSLLPGTHFESFSKEITGKWEAKIKKWKRFWDAVEAYRNAASDEDKKSALDDLKRDYPTIEIPK